jgi:hypothetical protein
VRRALALSVLLASASASALTPTAQDRQVYGKHRLRIFPTFDMTFEEGFSAPDYGPFSASTDGTPPGASFNFNPVAAQTSSIEPEQLHAEGGTALDPFAGVDALHELEARSVYSIDFTLDDERAFALAGQIDLTYDNPLYPQPDSTIPCLHSTVRITLSGPSGVVAEVAHTLPPPGPDGCDASCEASSPLSQTGVLPAGSYRLEARSDSNGQGILAVHSKCDQQVTGSYTADLALAPTVPALPLAAAQVLFFALALTARRRA